MFALFLLVSSVFTTILVVKTVVGGKKMQDIAKFPTKSVVNLVVGGKFAIFVGK